MIKCISFNTATKQFASDCRVTDISELIEQPETVVWADVSDPTSQDFLDLAEEFGFHPLAIEDCRHLHQRPKIEEFKNYYFIVLYEAELVDPEQRLDVRELNIFLGKNFLVTVHSRPIRSIETARHLWPEWLDRADQGSGLVVYLLIDAVIDQYMPLLDALSEQMDQLEDRIFGEFVPAAIDHIFTIKKQLISLRRTVAPLRDVFNTLLRREQPIFTRETHMYFRDVFDHVIRVIDTVDTMRDILGSITDAYLSISNNRMSLVMKRLTSIATILMSVTLIAGIYGMNFHFMPELRWKYGYVYALSSMLIAGAMIYVYLRKIKWL
jgi:magnesium transporter